MAIVQAPVHPPGDVHAHGLAVGLRDRGIGRHIVCGDRNPGCKARGGDIRQQRVHRAVDTDVVGIRILAGIGGEVGEKGARCSSRAVESHIHRGAVQRVAVREVLADGIAVPRACYPHVGIVQVSSEQHRAIGGITPLKDRAEAQRGLVPHHASNGKSLLRCAIPLSCGVVRIESPCDECPGLLEEGRDVRRVVVHPAHDDRGGVLPGAGAVGREDVVRER